MKKLLTLVLLLPVLSFAQKTQYANFVTSTQQDTSIIGTCILQAGDVSIVDSVLSIDGVSYLLKRDSSFTDYMDFTDTYYNKFTIVIRQEINGKIKQIIIQDADDNSKSYCIR